MSVVSSTDVEVFRRLSNPEVVDFNASSTRQITQQLREAMERAVSSSEPHAEGDVAEAPLPPTPAAAPPERAPAAAAATSSFSSAVQALSNAAAARRASQPSSLPVPAQSASLRPITEEEGSSDSEENPPAASSSSPLRPSICGRLHAAEPPPSTERQSSSSSSSAAAPSPQVPVAPPPRYLSSPTASEEEETRLEKQGLLLDLHALQTKGVRLTREFTMNDSVTELEFELQKQTALQNTCSAVQNMKDMLRIGFNGMELLNAKMGPFICMDGWAESLTTDMKRFDAPLEKIYKRYWRKSSMSPVMELGMIILGSLAMHHFKLKVFGRPSAPAAASETTHHHPSHRAASAAEDAPPAAAAASTTSSSAARNRRRLPNDGLRSTRPVLRSPMSLLGG